MFPLFAAPFGAPFVPVGCVLSVIGAIYISEKTPRAHVTTLTPFKGALFIKCKVTKKI